MVKKTLLSLAIAATTAGLAGCNLSSTDQYENKITGNPPAGIELPAATRATYPLFNPAGSIVPLGIDFVFGINSTLEDGEPGKDGTANTADTTPPVTTAINQLDGFSTVAPIYIDFNNKLDSDSVSFPGNVILLKFRNAVDNPAIDSLDLAGIAAASGTDGPIKEMVSFADFEARYVAYTPDGMNSQHAIQILFKKPLEPKTKYMVILTDNILDFNGEPIGQSADYVSLLGTDVLPSRALEGARTLVKTWNSIAQAALAAAPVLSYTFTTGSPQDVLKAMAAPALGLVGTVGKAEAAIIAAMGETTGLDTLNSIASAVIANPALSGAASELGVTNRESLKASALAPYYLKAVIENAIAPAKGIDLTALAEAVDAPQSRTFKPLMADASNAVAVPYTTLLTSVVTAKVKAQVTAAVEANRATIESSVEAAVLGANPDATDAEIADAVAAEIANRITTGVTAQSATITATVSAMTSGGALYEGGLEIPNYLPEATVGTADAEIGSWSASDDAAVTLGLTQAPRDRNGTTNVTYRFPFAAKVSDNVIPVMVTLPADSCDPDGSGPAPAITKPADGWPVAIYQHGITVDRTAGVLVGNALAKACVAMVAIDHAMHGVGPTSSTGLVFNVDTIAQGAVAGTETAALSPFALARAGAVLAGDAFFADLKERHNKVGKNAAQENVAMAFAAAGAAANVGASGDLYINLSDFARTRDGMRQTVLDLMNLNASIGDMDVNGDGYANDLDPANVYFIGHSLGGIIGTTFVSVNNNPDVQTFNANLPEIKAAVLGNPGSGVVKLLENSPSIGAAKILPGLYAKAGLEQGSARLEKFFGVLQATVDSADPINFAYEDHMQSLPVITYTAVNDIVVPNNTLNPYKFALNAQGVPAVVMDGSSPVSAPDTAKSYLSGTEPLIAALGDTTVINGSTSAGPVAGTRFSVRTDADESTHGTFSSADYADTFTEIFTQVGYFLSENLGDLNEIVVSDPSVLEQLVP